MVVSSPQSPKTYLVGPRNISLGIIERQIFVISVNRINFIPLPHFTRSLINTDGLSGFEEAIEAVYPQTVVQLCIMQLCIVHMIRNSLKFAT